MVPGAGCAREKHQGFHRSVAAMGCGASLSAYAARTTGQRSESRGPTWRLEFGTYVEFAAKDLAVARRLVEGDAERQVKDEKR